MKLEGELSWVVLYACVRVIVARDLIIIMLIWKPVVQDGKLCLQLYVWMDESFYKSKRKVENVLGRSRV